MRFIVNPNHLAVIALQTTGSKELQAGNGLYRQVRRRRSGNASAARPVGSNKSAIMKAKLEGSRRSARECRARRKMRYQCLQEMVTNRERAILSLRRDLEMVRYEKFTYS